MVHDLKKNMKNIYILEILVRNFINSKRKFDIKLRMKTYVI